MAIPNVKIPVLDADGSLTLPWRRWAQSLAGTDGGAVTPAEFQALVDLVATIAAEAATALAEAEAAQNAAASAELIALVDLGADEPAAPVGAGLGFEAEGLLLDDEDLGVSAWPVDVTFSAANTNSYLVAGLGNQATADAVFRLIDSYLVVQGTITVLAGTRIGVFAWTTDPYVHPANTQLYARAPATADATLATINAIVAGTIAS